MLPEFQTGSTRRRITAFRGHHFAYNAAMMETPGTPKFSGSHRRWTRPSGELSRFNVICGIVIVLSLDAMIVDYWIAPESGRAIAERVRGRHPKVKVMHISGYPREHLDARGWFFPGAAFLGKPFGIEQIQESVAALLAQD